MPGTNQAPDSAPFFEFDHVSIAFGESPVLNDISFQVNPGETLCLLGRSGVGKSVSLRMFMGFLKPTKGRVISAGEEPIVQRQNWLASERM